MVLNVSVQLLDPVLRQNIMAGQAWWSKSIHLKAEKQQREEGVKDNICSPRTPHDPKIHSLQLGPTSFPPPPKNVIQL